MMDDATEEINDSVLRGVHAAKVRPHTTLGFHSDCLNYGTSESHHCVDRPKRPWRSSSKYIDPGYGFEKCWRSSRARVQGGGDSHFGRDAAPVASGEQNQWKSSIRYINPGSGSWSAEWRSSIKAVKSKSNDSYTEWRPGVRVFKLADGCTEWRLSGGRRHVPAITHPEPLWRSCRGPGDPPPLKWIPPFRNLKLPPSKNKSLRKRVSGYSGRHPQLQLFSPPLEIGGRRSNSGSTIMPNAKEIRAKVAAYFKLHPPFHLFSKLYEKPASGASTKEFTSDGFHHAIRQYIPGGHEHHFENPGCVAKASTALPVRTTKMWCATGPQHHPATYRDVITGKLGPLDDFKPPKATLGPTLLAPAGNFNKDVMDSRFAGSQNMLEPEIPSYSSRLYNEAHDNGYKDYRRNLLNGFCTDHFKTYLYEANKDHLMFGQ